MYIRKIKEILQRVDHEIVIMNDGSTFKRFSCNNWHFETDSGYIEFVLCYKLERLYQIYSILE